MLRRARFWAFLGVMVLALAGTMVLTAAKAAPNIQLRATFRGEVLPGAPGADYYVDKILNDARGPYVTDNRKGVSVWFTPDRGDLFFKFEHHSSRSALVIFPNDSTPCGFLPDTAGVYPELPDDPVDFLRFMTNNYFAYGPPYCNFLTMTPGVPQQVRMWTAICSTNEHYFYIKYNDSDPTHIAGVVEAVAFDTNGDGKLDRWEIYPVPGTNDAAYLWKWPEGNDQGGGCFYMTAPMPFKLILERL